MAKFYLERASFTDPTSTFNFQVSLSTDGSSWKHWMGCTAPGGVYQDEDGNQEEYSWLEGPIPAGTTKLKSSIVSQGPTQRSAIHVEFS